MSADRVVGVSIFVDLVVIFGDAAPNNSLVMKYFAWPPQDIDSPVFCPALPGKCNVERNLRVDCGQPSISRHECARLGCCYDAQGSVCFYRLNGEFGDPPSMRARAEAAETGLSPPPHAACSVDGHFVFSVTATDTEVPVDPAALLVKGQPHCRPVITTPDTAVFKIGLKECGSTMKVV